MKKNLLGLLLAVALVILGFCLTMENLNPYFDEEYEALTSSSKWHHEYTSSTGNEVFWKNDGSEYFIVEVFGDHHDKFLNLNM